MKKLLFTLLLLAVVGCSAEDWERGWSTNGSTATERNAYRENLKDKKAMLTDGRIHIGMTAYEFATLWGIDIYPDRSTSAYGVTEWWRFDWRC